MSYAKPFSKPDTCLPTVTAKDASLLASVTVKLNLTIRSVVYVFLPDVKVASVTSGLTFIETDIVPVPALDTIVMFPENVPVFVLLNVNPRLSCEQVPQ